MTKNPRETEIETVPRPHNDRKKLNNVGRPTDPLPTDPKNPLVRHAEIQRKIIDEKIDVHKVKEKAAKVGRAALVGSNLLAVSTAMTPGETKTPEHAAIQAASALPGAAGWVATGAHYAKKGIDYINSKKMKKESVTMSLKQILEEIKKEKAMKVGGGKTPVDLTPQTKTASDDLSPQPEKRKPMKKEDVEFTEAELAHIEAVLNGEQIDEIKMSKIKKLADKGDTKRLLKVGHKEMNKAQNAENKGKYGKMMKHYHKGNVAMDNAEEYHPDGEQVGENKLTDWMDERKKKKYRDEFNAKKTDERVKKAACEEVEQVDENDKKTLAAMEKRLEDRVKSGGRVLPGESLKFRELNRKLQKKTKDKKTNEETVVENPFMDMVSQAISNQVRSPTTPFTDAKNIIESDHPFAPRKADTEGTITFKHKDKEYKDSVSNHQAHRNKYLTAQGADEKDAVLAAYLKGLK